MVMDNITCTSQSCHFFVWVCFVIFESLLVFMVYCLCILVPCNNYVLFPDGYELVLYLVFKSLYSFCLHICFLSLSLLSSSSCLLCIYNLWLRLLFYCEGLVPPCVSSCSTFHSCDNLKIRFIQRASMLHQQKERFGKTDWQQPSVSAVFTTARRSCDPRNEGSFLLSTEKNQCSADIFRALHLRYN